MPFVTHLEYHRRKRRWFTYDWQAGQRPSAEVIQLPVMPRLIPIPHMQVTDMIAPPDHQQIIDLLREQIGRMPGNYLGVKIRLAFRALELEVGEEAAAAQVQQIIADYLREAA